MPELSVAENLSLGRPPRRFGLVDTGRMARQAAELLARVERGRRSAHAGRQAGHRPQQMVEIAKALALNARVLIMDEPTAVLTTSEVEQAVRPRPAAPGRGRGDRVHHPPAGGDRRDRRPGDGAARRPFGGRGAGRHRRRTSWSGSWSAARSTSSSRASPAELGEPLLEVTGLSRRGAFDDVSFEVRAGEVVGLSGLVGAGRTEVARAIFGADRYDSGEVTVRGGVGCRRTTCTPPWRPGSGWSRRTARARAWSSAPTSARTSAWSPCATPPAPVSSTAGGQRTAAAEGGRPARHPDDRPRARRSAPCPAATSRRWSSASGWSPTRTCSSSTSRPAASTWGRRSRSTS